MEAVLAVAVGVLFGTGVFMVMRRSVIKLAIGLAMISHSTNLLVFTAVGLTRGTVPIVEAGASRLAEPHGDPLPQAMILTAIVISFGVIAFALALIRRTIAEARTDDVDRLNQADA